MAENELEWNNDELKKTDWHSRRGLGTAPNFELMKNRLSLLL